MIAATAEAAGGRRAPVRGTRVRLRMNRAVAAAVVPAPVRRAGATIGARVETAAAKAATVDAACTLVPVVARPTAKNANAR